MKRSEIVNEISSYFSSQHWNDIVKIYTQPTEPIYHFHAFVDNQVEYHGLQTIFEANMNKRGLVLDREIDHVGPGPGRAALHGVHPFGKGFVPLLDWFWEYSDKVILRPMDNGRGEIGTNLLSWGKNYMDKWFEQFQFKCVGYDEEEKIYDWFNKGKQWKELTYLVENFEKEGIAHLHCNTEINFDPKVLDLLARKEMKKIGWTICNATPCVYKVGDSYRGKITYSLAHPEEVFDISWLYNPDVVIRPSAQTFVFKDRPDFDVWTVKMFEDTAVRGGKYIELTDSEIDEIIASF